MTVIVAARSRERGVWIGSDTLGVIGAVKGDVGPKWVLGGRWALGWSGHHRFSLAARQVVVHCQVENGWDLATELRAALRADGWKLDAGDGLPPEMDGNAVLTDGVRIWRMCRSFSLVEADRFTACGSGCEFALGAMAAVDCKADGGASGLALVQMGLRIAAELCDGIGGRLWWTKLERCVGEPLRWSESDDERWVR